MLALPEWKLLNWSFAALLVSKGMILIYPKAAPTLIDEALT